MTTIPATFSRHGFLFTLLARTAKAAVYEQSIGSKVYAFETHRIRVRKAGVQFGKEVPATEYLPSDREWGVSGKTYSASLYHGDEARSLSVAQMGRWSGDKGI